MRRALVAGAIGALLAGQAAAQDVGGVRFGAWSWKEVAFTQDEARDVWGLRGAINAPIVERIRFAARFDGTLVQDRGTVDVDELDVRSFRALEMLGTLYRPVWEQVSLGVLFGTAIPVEESPLIRNPKTLAGCARWGDDTGALYAYACAGWRQEVGDGVRALIGAQVPIRFRDFGLGLEYASGAADVTKIKVTYQLPF